MKNTKKLTTLNKMRGLKMTINKKYFLFLLFLIIEISVFGKSYKALPSIVIEQKNGKVEKFEDDIFQNPKGDCKCILEIKNNLLLVYYTSDEKSSNREDKEVKPESFSIKFKETSFEGRFFISGCNQKGKFVDGYIDETNKNGSLCIYDANGIDLYLIFEYAVIM